MLRGRLAVVIVALFLIDSAWAYKRVLVFPPPLCADITRSDIIFIGKVESVSPAVLNLPDPEILKRYEHLTSLLEKNEEPSAVVLDQIRHELLQILSDLPETEKTFIRQSASLAAITARIEQLSEKGVKVTLKVLDSFKGHSGSRTEVSANLSACNERLLPGETYLIVANYDENRVLQIDGLRTARLSDSGGMLALLYNALRNGESSGSIEGLLSTAAAGDDAKAREQQHRSPYKDGAIVRIESRNGITMTIADEDGRFRFLGLLPDDYILTTYPEDMDEGMATLSIPVRVRVEIGRCVEQIVPVNPAPKDEK